MIRFLRTASTRRLAATLAAAVAVIGGGTAIAVAAGSGGPVPQPASLATAIQVGLSAPKLTGISADITFTNHLIGASNLQGSDPLLQGASGRLWFSPGTHQLRLELQSNNGDAQVLVSHGSFWVSDPSSSTVYEGTLPADMHTGTTGATGDQLPSMTEITNELNKLAEHLDFNGATAAPFSATPGDVAGQPTYSVRVTPKHDGGLLGAVQLAWDASHGVPLDVSIYASGDPNPVLELQAANVSYGPVDPSVFAITPPSGDSVVKIDTSGASGSASADNTGVHHVSGLAAVAASVPFSLKAPATAAGLPRQDVSGLEWGGKPGALITYGEGIGGIAVIERPAGASGGPASSQSHSGLSLPTISIDGISAHELDTALGTGVMFTSAGVSYAVLGSVPPTAAEAAAKDIAKAP